MNIREIGRKADRQEMRKISVALAKDEEHTHFKEALRLCTIMSQLLAKSELPDIMVTKWKACRGMHRFGRLPQFCQVSQCYFS